MNREEPGAYDHAIALGSEVLTSRIGEEPVERTLVRKTVELDFGGHYYVRSKSPLTGLSPETRGAAIEANSYRRHTFGRASQLTNVSDLRRLSHGSGVVVQREPVLCAGVSRAEAQG
ncbi:hypothetical protein [Microbacterium sp. TWP3-1-2b2]|uniref:hypothetical protein n=1 Tax=Microbacterium sp. TWP3-1-2b2 TaxID=2804651 RepID=UPI003CEF48DC